MSAGELGDGLELFLRSAGLARPGQTLMPPPTDLVRAVIAAARFEGRADAPLWVDYAWMPTTWPPSPAREAVVLLECCMPTPAWSTENDPHTRLETAPLIGAVRPLFTSTTPAAGERRGPVVAWRLAVCARHRTVWYEARTIAPSAPRRPGASS